MKKILINNVFITSVAILLLIFLFALVGVRAQAIDVPLNTTIQVYFSPSGGCTDAIVEELGKAKSEIFVQAYSFTSKRIAEAIAKAKKAGVKVEIVLDKSNKTAKYSAGDFMAHMDIPTYIDSRHAIAHNKIMIIDRETVITGSFNFTKAAEKNNAENLLIIKSKELANAYLTNWNEHKKHSDEYHDR